MRIRIFAAGLFALLLGVGAGAADVTPPPPPQDELVPPPPPPPEVLQSFLLGAEPSAAPAA